MKSAVWVGVLLGGLGGTAAFAAEELRCTMVRDCNPFDKAVPLEGCVEAEDDVRVRVARKELRIGKARYALQVVPKPGAEITGFIASDGAVEVLLHYDSAGASMILTQVGKLVSRHEGYCEVVR